MPNSTDAKPSQKDPATRLLPQSPLGKQAQEILDYWFSKQNPYSMDYRPYGSLWFRGGPKVDKEIQQRFEPLVIAASKGELCELKQTPHGMLTLVILLDQFPRNMYRGTGNMFLHDSLALTLAQEAIAKGMDKKLALVERLFLYYPLEHSEDVKLAEEAGRLIDNLGRESFGNITSWFYKMAKVARQHLEILQKFNRYPYRNEILGRKSSKEEIEFLQKHSYGFMKSVKKTEKKNIEQPGNRKLKILVLHSFRQNSRIMRTRTRKLRRELATVAELVYANAPLPYMPQGETREAVLSVFGKIPDTEHQRCWWNATEDNQVYEGLELSLAYIKHLNAVYGPFDGILGFSQGGSFTGLLAALKTIYVQFVICISGFPPRTDKYTDLFAKNAIKVPSLHIVGGNDILVDPERTIKLAKSFANASVVTHSGGHFVPDRWPLDKIRDFLLPFYKNPINPNELLQLKELTLEQKLLLLGRDCTFYKQLVKADVFIKVKTLDKELEIRDIVPVLRGLNDEELVISGWFLHFSNPQTKTWLNWTLALMSFSYTTCHTMVDTIPKIAGWKYLKELAVANHKYTLTLGKDTENCANLHRKIVDMFAKQLKEDFSLFKSIADDTNLEKLQWISDCAVHAPRVRNAVDRKTRLAKDIARTINPLQQPKEDRHEDGNDPWAYTKQMAARRYRDMLAELSKALERSSLEFADEQFNQYHRLFYTNEYLLNNEKSISAAVVSPAPEPVLPSALENLEPLFSFLKKKKPVAAPEAFARGTLTPDGRLDLCKQVVGPQGIKPLLNAMENNPFVTKLLLGNNIVGDDGGKWIANHIASGISKLDVWYIAGNNLSEKGIKPVCEVLANDTQVTQLWLKRNPIKAEGAKHLAQLLTVNQTLEVLDLVNCGLLDQGLEIIIAGLSQNKSLRHIYLCANGITSQGVAVISKYLQQHDRLKNLFISCNRIGVKGAEVLAAGLQANTSLERLSLASCRLGADGARIICDALTQHPNLLHLDLGYMRNTNAIGEVGNFIGDEGAAHIAKFIAANATLRSLDLLHNNISQKGLNYIREAMRTNRSLIKLRFTQFGAPHNEYAREEINARLRENMAQTSNSKELKEKALAPEYLKKVLSVYRTR